MRFLEIRFFGRDKRHIVNPLSTIILMPLISVPQLLGIIFWDNFEATAFIALGITILFVATYLIGITVAKRARVTNA